MYIDVVYRIHHDDVPPGTQWRTRVLYNAYPPFRLNFVLDTHVFPCDKLAVKELFDQFDKTDVDISFGNRQNKQVTVMGAAALFRAGKGSHFFWKAAYNYMKSVRFADDQNGMGAALKHLKNNRFTFRWLSFNWAFASHGVLSNGVFKGSGKCYRASLPVNGPVRFIHGSPGECILMNGVHNELINQQRCYFTIGTCLTTMNRTTVALNESQFIEYTYPAKAANLHWDEFREYSPTDIFWPDRNFTRKSSRKHYHS